MRIQPFPVTSSNMMLFNHLRVMCSTELVYMFTLMANIVKVSRCLCCAQTGMTTLTCFPFLFHLQRRLQSHEDRIKDFAAKLC